MHTLHALIQGRLQGYVVRGMTEWLPKWKKNGRKNSRGSRVANSDYFCAVDSLVEALEILNVLVMFWRVPREMNKMADSMAKFALEQD